MDVVQTIALTLGVGWASGINLYAAVATLGLLGSFGQLELPPSLALVQDPLVIGAAILMYCVEFFADKVPVVDSGWDLVHTFIRIPAGAALAAGVVGDVSPAVQLAAGLVGGSFAAGAHATKAGARALINTSPEPVTNWIASTTEDAAVFAGVWAMVFQPWFFLGALALFVLGVIWLLPRLWRGIRVLGTRIARLFGARSAAPAPGSNPQP